MFTCAFDAICHMLSGPQAEAETENRKAQMERLEAWLPVMQAQIKKTKGKDKKRATGGEIFLQVAVFGFPTHAEVMEHRERVEKAKAARAAEEAAAARAAAEKALLTMETDAQALRAASEGTEALTAQLGALRAAQGSEVDAVQAELQTERKRHAAAEEQLRAEIAELKKALEEERNHSAKQIAALTTNVERLQSKQTREFQGRETA